MKDSQSSDTKIENSSAEPSRDSAFRPLRVVFFGTPDFAVETLRRISEAGHEVVAVVTAPDKPAGRGRKLKASPVKEYALSQGWPVLQPVNLKDPEFIRTLSELRPDAGVVVAFRILPESVYAIPRYGTFNVHASLLPDYRGAAPIHHALINGEEETGVTTFFLEKKVDTGDMILQKSVKIPPRATFGQMHDILKEEGARLAEQTLDLIARGEVRTVPQDHTKAVHPAPKLTKENTRIDWHKPGPEVERFILGLSPVPGAWTTWSAGGPFKRAILYDAVFEPGAHTMVPGVAAVEDGTLKVAVPDGFIRVLRLKPQDRKEMDVRDFLNGLRDVKELVFK
ncbi:MAG: methionyl-tRNA formyltransferase [Chlorobi bacterium]|nr:methionyl-tRNA formyltransferase [Chlorobiota bacterium]